MEASYRPPPFKVGKGSTGIGKSRAALDNATSLARQGHKVVYLTRTVALADELAQRVGSGVNVRIWRGRDQPDPNRPGQKMCQELDLVRAARSVYADPNDLVCPICAYRAACGYLKQREVSASIWFGASSLLWHEMPAIMKGATLLVIDEAFVLDGLKGVDGTPILVRTEELKQEPWHPSSVSQTADLRAELMPLRRKLFAALRCHPLGGIERNQLSDAGLTVDDCANARKLEWRAKIELSRQPTFDDLQKAIRKAEGNKDVSRRAMLWAALEKLLSNPNATLSGRAEVIEDLDVETGTVHRAVRLYDASAISKGWAELPTLHLDATANLTLIRTRVPHAELIADVVADEVHTRVIQYHSHAFGKQALTSNREFLVKVWSSAVSHAQVLGGHWLIVMQKAAKEKILEWSQHTVAAIPPFVDLAHHNALAGIDRYRNVRGIIVIGRTLPSPKDVEHIAGILTGFAVERCGDWYPAEMIPLNASDGSMVTVERDTHPDPLAAEILRQICDGELIQIIGRGRGSNRSAADPLEIVLYGSVPVSVPVDELRVWEVPSLYDELLAREGIVLSSYLDMAEAFALNPETVKKDRCRKWQKGTDLYKRFLYRNVPICQPALGELRGAVYRRDRSRHTDQRVVYDPRIVMDPKTWLIARVGPLAVYQPLPTSVDPAGSGNTAAPNLRHARQMAKRERDRAGKRARRRAAGAVPRSEYLAHALSRTKPWQDEGISRRTWERRQARKTTGQASSAGPSARAEGGSVVASPSAPVPARSPAASPSAVDAVSLQDNRSDLSATELNRAEPAVDAVPKLLTKPIQLELFNDDRPVSEAEALPEWDGGIAPPAIRMAIDQELRRRGARHEELGKAIGLSRSQITNILRGRFGTTPVTANALRRLLGFWRSAA